MASGMVVNGVEDHLGRDVADLFPLLSGARKKKKKKNKRPYINNETLGHACHVYNSTEK